MGSLFSLNKAQYLVQKFFTCRLPRRHFYQSLTFFAGLRRFLLSRLLSKRDRETKMVIPPAVTVRPPRLFDNLKPYVLKMHFTNNSHEKALRETMEVTRDVAAASKIGKIREERLLIKDTPTVAIHMKKEQRYHGKVKAVIDSVREAGVKLL
ncbi:Uncharacterized protein Rs2_42686 [Raphanus sativus]|nr:Uncharacterized protein Rs2_42686 [Raphanus sativus]